MYFKEEDKIFKQEKEKEKNGKKSGKWCGNIQGTAQGLLLKKGYNTLTNQNKGGTS